MNPGCAGVQVSTVVGPTLGSRWAGAAPQVDQDSGDAPLRGPVSPCAHHLFLNLALFANVTTMNNSGRERSPELAIR